MPQPQLVNPGHGNVITGDNLGNPSHSSPTVGNGNAVTDANLGNPSHSSPTVGNGNAISDANLGNPSHSSPTQDGGARGRRSRYPASATAAPSHPSF
jgi:hypothetical protein